MLHRWLGWVGIVWLVLGASPTGAQVGCTVVEQITYPLDPHAFEVVQAYAERSVRHQGLYHAGEDWAILEGNALGQSVYAIASGEVVYAYPQGWGKDGGMVILAHRLPDDTRAYTLYGHLSESDAVPFPQAGACVQAGEAIGVIGDALPTAHLHFEVRLGQGSAPEFGYTAVHPNTLNYTHPTAFIQNWQARFTPSLRWLTELVQVVGQPLPLNDDSFLTLTHLGMQLRRVSSDGRVLWRKHLAQTAVSLEGVRGTSLIYFADGTVQEVDAEGNFGTFWQLFTPLNDLLFYHEGLPFFASEGGMIRLDADRRQVLQYDLALPLVAWVFHTPQMIALWTRNNELHLLNPSTWAVVDVAQLSAVPSVVGTPDGALWVYTGGIVWQVATDGTWERTAWQPRNATPNGGLTFLETGDIAVAGLGELLIYTANGEVLRQHQLNALESPAQMWEMQGQVVVATLEGGVQIINPWTGTRCAFQAYAYGIPHGWLGGDTLLRMQWGGTFLGVEISLAGLGC